MEPLPQTTLTESVVSGFVAMAHNGTNARTHLTFVSFMLHDDNNEKGGIGIWDWG